MGARWRGGATGLLILLAGSGACSSQEEADPGPTELERVERLAADVPAVLVARVQQAYEQAAMRVSVRRLSSQLDDSYTFIADQSAWRADTPTPDDVAGDGRSTLLAADDEICFDREFRPVLWSAVAMSYGFVDFDPKPWSCTPADFGLNPLATQTFRREDPRWRIENLTTDPGTATVEVEEVDGRPLLHLRTTGVTYDGPLDPLRPAYDLWVGSDLLPVRMETTTLTWDFDYPADLPAELTAPSAEERGSYGYAIGPGQGSAKACLQGGPCPERAELDWGDGR